MATDGDLIRRVDFEVRASGLYRRIGDGEWSRVAKRLAVITVSFRHGWIKVTEAAIPKKAKQTILTQKHASEELANAARAIRLKLGHFDNMVDLIKHRSFLTKISRTTLDSAYGFRARIPGIGQALVVRPEALRHWLPSSVSVRQAVKQLDAHGYLIRGCDGKLSRQVKLHGLFRQRYYCFKLTVAKLISQTELKRPSTAKSVSSPTQRLTSADEQHGLLEFRRPKPTGPFLWND